MVIVVLIIVIRKPPFILQVRLDLLDLEEPLAPEVHLGTVDQQDLQDQTADLDPVALPVSGEYCTIEPPGKFSRKQ